MLISCVIYIQFAEYFYMLHPFKINFYSYFVLEISVLCHDQKIFNATWIWPLPEFFIYSTKSQERTATLLSIRENYYHYTDYVKRTKTWKMYKILNGFGKNIFNLIFIEQRISKHISLPTNIVFLCKMRCDLNYLHGVHVIPWQWLSKTIPRIRKMLKISPFVFNRPKTDN